jgi:hypothetical protein
MNGVKNLDNQIKKRRKRKFERKAQEAIHESITKTSDVHIRYRFPISFGKE